MKYTSKKFPFVGDFYISVNPAITAGNRVQFESEVTRVFRAEDVQGTYHTERIFIMRGYDYDQVVEMCSYAITSYINDKVRVKQGHDPVLDTSEGSPREILGVTSGSEEEV